VAACGHQLLLDALLNCIGVGAKVLVRLDGLHSLVKVCLQCIVVFVDDAIGFKGAEAVWRFLDVVVKGLRPLLGMLMLAKFDR
jgi:hypothetical protein